MAKLHEVPTNVALGSRYLKLLLEDLKHPVLASAAYNAGPGRARRWRDAKPLEGAIYAENIPFTETRDYVKKVMSNTIYYALLLEGRSMPLKQRLNTIAARAVTDKFNEELP
jgi:soluble lytic murein transglycosylase